MKTELEQHYLETTYSVFINGNKYDIKIGAPIPSSIQNLLDKNEVKTAVMITAWNPRSELFSSQDNNHRNTELRTYLANKNYTFFDAIGEGECLTEPKWPGEEGFFISGITKEEAEKLAVNYEQYAYVWLEKGKPVSLVFSHIWHIGDDVP